MTMTLDQALSLCEHASPMPHLAGQALRVMRDEIARIKTDEGLVSKAMVDDACTAYRLLMDHEDGPCELAMRAALLAVWPNPPARAAQLWEMKQRACRAHALCNELRLAHPEIPELGDDGVLHEAIHDILRVDTPTAAPAQAAQVDSEGNPLIEVSQRDANNYCRILSLLGMEEEGDPVAEIGLLIAARDAEPVAHPLPTRAHVLGDTAVIVGTPQGEHNCDAMGCGSFGPHVLYRIPVTMEAEPVAQGEAYLAGDAEEVAESLSDDAAQVRDIIGADSEIADNMERAAEILRTAAQPRAVPDEVVTEIVEAATEVYRISDREHEAWHRLRAALAAAQESGQ